MKSRTRFVALLLVGLFVIFSLPVSSAAASNPYLQTAGSADFTVSTAFCAHGETTKLFVDISANSQMSAGLFALRYDTTMLKAKSVDVGIVLKNGHTSTNITDSGIVKVSYADVNPNYEAGRLFEVEFETIGSVPEGQVFVDIPVELEVLDLKNYEDRPIASNTSNGKITLIERRYGDVNHSGDVSASDALLTLYDNAKLITLDDEQKILADVNGDGKVSVTDALQILQYSAGYISNYTIFQLPKPSGLSVTGKEEESLEISWDEIPYVLGYNVYLDGAQVNTVLVTSTGYTFTDLTQDTKYDIEVQAVNALMTSQKSDKLTVSTSKAERMVVFKDYDGTILDNQIVLSGTAANPPEVPGRKGYTFTGWDVDTSNITDDVTITAQYQINSYSVKLDYLYDDLTIESDYVFNTKVSKPDFIQRDNYTLEGWYRDRNYIKKWDFDTDVVEDNMTLYAKWVTWSAWSTTIPDNVTEDDYMIEQRTEYRYRTKATKSSSSSSMSGWTPIRKEITGYTNWSEWSTSRPGDKEGRQIESQNVPATYKTVWHYNRWTATYTNYSSYGGGYWPDGQSIVLDNRLNRLPQYDADGYAAYGNYYISGYSSGLWWNEWSESVVATAAYTQYRYRDAIYTYYYYKWSDWSDWSPVAKTADDNTEVQTRTVYHYLLKQK